MPDLYLPAMPPLGLIARLREAFERRACRRELRALLQADDDRLTDIGLSRAAIRAALRDVDNPCETLSRRLSAPLATRPPSSASIPRDDREPVVQDASRARSG